MALDELFEKVQEEKISRRTILKAGAAVGIGLAGATLAGCTSPTPTPGASVTPTPAPQVKDTLNVGYLVRTTTRRCSWPSPMATSTSTA